MTTLAKVTWDAGSGKWSVWQDFVNTTSGMTPLEPSDGNFYGSTLVLANVDHDSPTVKYQGKHEELFADPQILAVLAAAPFYTGENDGNSQTSISFGNGTGVDDQSTIGLRTSTSIGYMSPDFFGEASFSWSLTFGLRDGRISDSSVEVSQTETWTAGAEDAVVFQVVPFDVYYYTIMSSPNPAEVGQSITINVPRTIDTYKVPVALYNASVVGGPTIGPDVLTHTVGDPSTYPTANSCASAPAGGSFGALPYLVNGSSWCYASENALPVGVGPARSPSPSTTTPRPPRGRARTSASTSRPWPTSAGPPSEQSMVFTTATRTPSTPARATTSPVRSAISRTPPTATSSASWSTRECFAGTETTYPAFLVDYWVEGLL